MKSAEGDMEGRDMKKGKGVPSFGSAVGRRDLMKIGAGVVLTTLGGHAVAESAEAEAPKPASVPPPQRASAGIANENIAGDWKNYKTGAGYKNDAGRISGNGAMDNTSRQLVSYVTSFSEANLTSPVLTGIGNYMLDALTAIIAGFESEPGRIGAQFGRTIQGDMKSTIFGYGVVTSPEAATFANSAMIRECDYNDAGPGGHSSDIVPGILSIGEALHSTGTQVLTAVALGIELLNGFSHAERKPVPATVFDTKYDGVATALATGKLLGLDEDRLANALSMALVPQIALDVAHVGALSHWKSCHSPWMVRGGVLASQMARLGLTAPAQPFEERGGLWDAVTGPFKELRLPVSPDGN